MIPGRRPFRAERHVVAAATRTAARADDALPAAAHTVPRFLAASRVFPGFLTPARAVRAVFSLARWPLLVLLWAYRSFVSPALPPACRYHPSCSRYAYEAIAVHGAVRGSWLALRRLLRCHPWAPGGPDPVPPRSGVASLHQRISS